MPTLRDGSFAFGSADHDRPCPFRFRVERIFGADLLRNPQVAENPTNDGPDVLQTATPAAGAAR